MRGTIIYDGVDLSQFGVYYDGSKEYDKPVKEMERVSIPGRNGDLFLPNDRWSNVPIPYDCYIKDDFQTNYDSLIAFLNSRKGYKVLETSGQPDVYRMASFLSAVTPEMGQFNKTGRFTLEFDCMPQRFLKSGTVAQEITGGSGTIMNPTAFESSPLLTVYGSGAIGINDETITIRNDAYGEITLSDRYMGKFFNPSYAGLFNEGDYITFGSGCVAVDVVLSDIVLPDSISVSLTGDLPSEIRDVTVTSSGKFIVVRFWFFQNAQAISSSTEYWDVNYEINAETDSGNAQVKGYFRESIDVDREMVRVITTISQISGYATKASATFEITGITGNSTIGGSYPFMIDLESLKSYKEINGSVVSLNHLVDFGIDAPTLKPGTNAITSDTYPSTQVDIVPRWWTL